MILSFNFCVILRAHCIFWVHAAACVRARASAFARVRLCTIRKWNVQSSLLLVRSTDYGHPERAFSKNLELLADILGHLGYFWPDYQHPFCYCKFLVHVYHYSTIISTKKTKPLYPTPKYLFGSGIWMLAAKNLRFSLRVSVVLVVYHCHGNFRNSWSEVKLTYLGNQLNSI